MNPLPKLIQEGLVEMIMEDGELYYQLTEEGRKVYEEIKQQLQK
jgi:predicted transcriptional regulator with HTH domain